MCHQDPPHYESLHLGGPSSNVTIRVHYVDEDNRTIETDCKRLFAEQRAYSLVLYPAASGMQCDLVRLNCESAALSWTSIIHE